MLAALAFLVAATLPQEPPRSAQEPAPAVQARPRRDPLKRFEGLDLSSDQKDRLRGIFAKRDGDRRERRKAVMAVLTREQRRKLREQRKDRAAAPAK